jgi:hypothetical protein
MTELLYNNKESVETIRNYLFSNDLKQEEIDEVIGEALDRTFIRGLDAGCVVQRNNRKRIENAQLKIADSKFNDWIDSIEEEICERRLSKKEKR